MKKISIKDARLMALEKLIEAEEARKSFVNGDIEDFNEDEYELLVISYFNPDIKFIPAGLVNQYYSFMVPLGSDILYFLNQEILNLINMREIQAILLKYFGSGRDMRNG